MYKKSIFLLLTALSMASCSDFLDMQPLDKVTPDAYFKEANQLGDYAIKYYDFRTLSGMTTIINDDNSTDIQVAGGVVQQRWLPGEWRVESTGSDWKFNRIRSLNFFFEKVLPQYEAGTITGSMSDIKHYIGEVYFLRAYEYFEKLKKFGDFPIITKVLSDDDEELIAANERKPMNHVARFILEDLDKAIELLSKASADGNKRNRITKDAAYLFKSRVALYVGTWLKYFKGTAFVPGTTNWPGNTKDYNKNIKIYETNIDDEINFFLNESLKAADVIASKIPLIENTFDDPSKLQVSPYVRMFADYDLSTYPEVIFWRDYDMTKNVKHQVNNFVQWPVAGGNTGYSKGYMESFLMENGLPIYASESNYQGDLTFESVREGRDDRLKQFIRVPKDELSPNLFAERPVLFGHEMTTTGYIPKKYKSNKPKAAQMGDDTGFPIFRAAEAYLNYMEADYELHGTVSDKSEQYWAALRKRAGVNPDYRVTDMATDMSIEARNSFAAYSAGKIIDVTLYNIRRERACEFIGEGYRYDDIRRWRSMDQLVDNPYQPEGINLWGSPTFSSWYKGQLYYVGDGSNKQANISSPELSNYIRPLQILPANLMFNGMRWTPAHYLNPIDMSQFNITSVVESDGSINHETSPIYQNPGWPTIANKGAEMVPGFN